MKMTHQKLFNRIKKANLNRTFITDVRKYFDTLSFEYDDPTSDNYYRFILKLRNEPIIINNRYTFTYNEWIEVTLYYTNKRTLEHGICVDDCNQDIDAIVFDSMEECAKNIFNYVR
jgi:hypothetical protein